MSNSCSKSLSGFASSVDRVCNCKKALKKGLRVWGECRSPMHGKCNLCTPRTDQCMHTMATGTNILQCIFIIYIAGYICVYIYSLVRADFLINLSKVSALVFFPFHGELSREAEGKDAGKQYQLPTHNHFPSGVLSRIFLQQCSRGGVGEAVARAWICRITQTHTYIYIYIYTLRPNPSFLEPEGKKTRVSKSFRKLKAALTMQRKLP